MFSPQQTKTRISRQLHIKVVYLIKIIWLLWTAFVKSKKFDQSKIGKDDIPIHLVKIWFKVILFLCILPEGYRSACCPQLSVLTAGGKLVSSPER